MTSKEALENISYELPMNCMEINIIKQDLENYEKLKQQHDKTLINNGELVCKNVKLEIANKNNEKVIEDGVKLMNKNLELNNKIEQLEKENQELKEKLEISQKANKELSFTANAYAKAQKPYIEKIQKLEKAIEILKERFNFKFNDEDKVIYLFIKGLSLHIYSWCIKSQQEYELLNEVLENEL